MWALVVCLHVCVRVRVHVCVRICMHAYVYVCMLILISGVPLMFIKFYL